MDNKRVIKTFVWYTDQCFFVSTIERQSSSPLGGRIWETAVWGYDWERGERGALVHESSGGEGCIDEHIRQVVSLQSRGLLAEETDRG